MTAVTVVWYDGNEHLFTHGYVKEGVSLHGVVNINGHDFPPDADIIATIVGHVEVHIWNKE